MYIGPWQEYKSAAWDPRVVFGHAAAFGAASRGNMLCRRSQLLCSGCRGGYRTLPRSTPTVDDSCRQLSVFSMLATHRPLMDVGKSAVSSPTAETLASVRAFLKKHEAWCPTLAVPAASRCKLLEVDRKPNRCASDMQGTMRSALALFLAVAAAAADIDSSNADVTLGSRQKCFRKPTGTLNSAVPNQSLSQRPRGPAYPNTEYAWFLHSQA